MFGFFNKLENLDIAEKVIERDKRFAQQYTDAKNIYKLEKIITTLVMFLVCLFVLKYIL